MKTMKAYKHVKYGDARFLQFTEMEKPAPKNNEILVRVFASTVNRTDCAMLRAKPFIMRFFMGVFKPRKPILGTEFAGKIEAVGSRVKLFEVGENIFGFDDMGLSSHAEYLTINENKAIALIPKNISYESAAASIEGPHYAINFINKVKIEPEQHILINGATGGIGSAALQLLKHRGVKVTAVCNTKNLNLIKATGADKIIDYTHTDFTQVESTYHFIFDAVGKSTFFKCKHLLKPGGTYISSELGPWIQNPILALLTPLFGMKKVVFPVPLNSKASIKLVKELLEQGNYLPIIDRTYPFEQLTDAFMYVETGEKTGNVVITIHSR